MNRNRKPEADSETPEFRARACREVLELSRPIREVAEEVGINAETLRTWLHRARVEGIEMAKAEETEHETRIRQLEAKLKKDEDDLYWAGQENLFLKKAAADSRGGCNEVGELSPMVSCIRGSCEVGC